MPEFHIPINLTLTINEIDIILHWATAEDECGGALEPEEAKLRQKLMEAIGRKY